MRSVPSPRARRYGGCLEGLPHLGEKSLAQMPETLQSSAFPSGVLGGQDKERADEVGITQVANAFDLCDGDDSGYSPEPLRSQEGTWGCHPSSPPGAGLQGRGLMAGAEGRISITGTGEPAQVRPWWRRAGLLPGPFFTYATNTKPPGSASPQVAQPALTSPT